MRFLECMEIHIPKQLEKQLKVLAPTWYEALNNVRWNRNKLSEDKQQELSSSYACCFIGEIHGFNDTYRDIVDGNKDRCDLCHAFAKDILYRTNGSATSKELVKFLRKVVEHFEQEHPTFFNIPVSRRR